MEKNSLETKLFSILTNCIDNYGYIYLIESTSTEAFLLNNYITKYNIVAFYFYFVDIKFLSIIKKIENNSEIFLLYNELSNVIKNFNLNKKLKIGISRNEDELCEMLKMFFLKICYKNNWILNKYSSKNYKELIFKNNVSSLRLKNYLKNKKFNYFKIKGNTNEYYKFKSSEGYLSSIFYFADYFYRGVKSNTIIMNNHFKLLTLILYKKNLHLNEYFFKTTWWYLDTKIYFKYDKKFIPLKKIKISCKRIKLLKDVLNSKRLFGFILFYKNYIFMNNYDWYFKFKARLKLNRKKELIFFLEENFIKYYKITNKKILLKQKYSKNFLFLFMYSKTCIKKVFEYIFKKYSKDFCWFKDINNGNNTNFNIILDMSYIKSKIIFYKKKGYNVISLKSIFKKKNKLISFNFNWENEVTKNVYINDFKKKNSILNYATFIKYWGNYVMRNNLYNKIFSMRIIFNFIFENK